MTQNRHRSWTSARAIELRRLIDSSIGQQVRRISAMPDRYFVAAGVDKGGVLSLLEQASLSVEAVHDVIAELPSDFGPPGGQAPAREGLHLRGVVAIAPRFRDRYRTLFDPVQDVETLSNLKTRGMVRIRVVEGEFMIDAGHLIRAG